MPETIGEILDRLTATSEAKLAGAPDHDREALHATLAVVQAVRLRVDINKVIDATALRTLQDVDLSMDDHGFDISATTVKLTNLIDGF